MLKFQLDTLDGVDENIQALYVEKDGKYNLSVDGAPQDMSESVAKLTKALESERGVSKSYKADIDKANMAKAEGSGDVESIKKQMNELHAVEIAGFNDKLASTSAQLRTLTIDNVITSAVAKEGGITEVLKPYVAGRTRLNESGQVEVLSENGKDVMVDKNGDNVSISSFVSSLKENSAFAGVFKGTTHSGGGTTQSDGSVGHKADKTTDQKVRDGLAAMRK